MTFFNFSDSEPAGNQKDSETDVINKKMAREKDAVKKIAEKFDLSVEYTDVRDAPIEAGSGRIAKAFSILFADNYDDHILSFDDRRIYFLRDLTRHLTAKTIWDTVRYGHATPLRGTREILNLLTKQAIVPHAGGNFMLNWWQEIT